MSDRERHQTSRGLVLTVGHSTRTFEQFASLLQVNGVRRFLRSRRHPHFDEEALSRRLPRACSVRYSHLPGLGGRRHPLQESPNAGWRNPSFCGYADHMATLEFSADFERLVELCNSKEQVCLMCSEAVPWRCHRRMIADALVVRGFPVGHIVGEYRRTVHVLTTWAKVVDETQLLYPPER